MFGVTEESPFTVVLDSSGNQQFASKMRKNRAANDACSKRPVIKGKIVLIDADEKWSKYKKQSGQCITQSSRNRQFKPTRHDNLEDNRYHRHHKFTSKKR